MPNKMLIDASHPEETRVVVTRGNRIEEFDFESQDKKQLRGNIYLARVTRVEPSLQAAFVEYGGNRHGFLAFSEIHPDYYQIPVADRQALLRADAEAAEAEDDDDEEERSGRKRRRSRNGKNRHRDEDSKASSDNHNDGEESADAGSAPQPGGETLADIEPFEATGFLSNTFTSLPTEGEEQSGGEAAAGEATDQQNQSERQQDASQQDAEAAQDTAAADEEATPPASDDDDSSGPAMAAAIEGDVVSEDLNDSSSDEADAVEARSDVRSDPSTTDDDDNDDDSGEDDVESVGAEDAIEEAQPRRRANRRQYKIQEVIKRRQILLVQVVKEERGNKGAALTTYLSLAGRYSVLMPNTARGGGISRKITNIQDRKRLKDVMKELEVPQGMGVILRTAGESRTKAEIKRDYEYLMRLWENVRTLTLQSTAPALVYEEGSLIKRSVRDLYNKEIDEIQVAGEEGYREAKDFMRMLMPSHAKMVQPYRDTVPIFARNGIEAQLDRMLQPQVNLKSGGYIIINQTEALVAIDVNSGRSTKEHSIEDTALQTNLEAADEVARQLRLRDLAGLIVVDFIDMEENRNNRAVEKRMKDALKNDRARIQVGRISHFGLLEMSRQRIRASVLESTTQTCPHCGGTGHIRSDSSVALHVIRAIEEYLLKDNRSHIVVRTPVTTALYVLNHKRSTLVELERRFGLSISMEADETLGSQHYAITKGAPVENPVVIAPPSFETVIEEEDDDAQMEPFDSSEVDADEDASESEARDNQNGKGEQGERDNDRKRRRRRRRRGGRERDNAQPQADASNQDDEATAGDDDVDADADGETVSTSSDVSAADTDQDHKKRRRGKRGGRRNRREDGEGLATAGDDQEEDQGSAEASDERDADVVAAEAAAGIDPEGERPEGEPEAVATAEPAAPAAAEAEAPAAEAEAAAPVKAPRARARRPRKTAASAAAVEEATADAAPAEEASSEQPTASSAEPEAPQQTSVTDAQPDGNAAAEAPVAHEADGADQDNSDSAEEAAPASRRRAGASDTPSEPVVTSNVTEPEKPRKGGWWQRKSFF